MTLDQLREHFSDEIACLTFFESVIWANGRSCCHCGHDKSYPLRGKTSRPGTYECARCKKQFRVTTKTPMHSTKLPFWKWLQGMYYIINSSKGISQPAAWKMGHAIREMMAPCGQLNGIVELDEKYIGGKPRPHDGKMHKRGRGTAKQ